MISKRTVEDFVFERFGESEYPRWVLLHMLQAHKNNGLWNQFVQHQQLWCTYEGERIQIVGADEREVFLSNGKKVTLADISDFERVETEPKSIVASENQVPPQCAPYTGIIHVDDWINDESGDPYARWWFNNFRWSAVLRLDWEEFTKPYALYGTYEGKRYRVTGCSRMGDVWLAEDHTKTHGYDHRVDLKDVTAWGPEP